MKNVILLQGNSHIPHNGLTLKPEFMPANHPNKQVFATTPATHLTCLLDLLNMPI